MYRPRPGHAVLLGAALVFSMHAAGEATDEASPAADAVVSQTRATPTERSREQALVLQRQLPASEQQQLQGQEETFLALWLTALTAQTAGTLILVPGYGQHADHPTIIGPLRRKLPTVGWNTLSISLPDAPGPQRPEATTPAAPEAPADADKATAAPEPEPEPAESGTAPQPANPTDQPARVPVEQTQMEQEAAPVGEPADTMPPDQAHAERIFARIDAAIAFAESKQPGEIVLVGNGSGAYWAARYAGERQPKALQRLALISLRAPSSRRQTQEPLALPDIPIGDFFYRNRADEQDQARQRLHASQRLKQHGYRQIGLQALPADPEAEREQLLRRLRGWLTPAHR